MEEISTLNLELNNFIDKELLSLHPIHQNFLSDFENILMKRDGEFEEGMISKSISITVYPSWIIYWFFKQNQYKRMFLSSDWSVNTFFLDKAVDSVVFRIIDNYSAEEFIYILQGHTYDEIKSSFENVIYKHNHIYPFNVYFKETDLNLENEGLLNNLIERHFESKLNNNLKKELIYNVEVIGDKHYDDSFLFGRLEFSVSIILNYKGKSETYKKTDKKIISFLNEVLPDLYLNRMGFLNFWLIGEENATRVYLTKLKNPRVKNINSIEFELEGYFCYNWIYELIIVPHFQVFEAFLSGRWNEKDFRSYMKNNFNLEKEDINQLKESVNELLITPYWIDSMTFEDIKKVY